MGQELKYDLKGLTFHMTRKLTGKWSLSKL